MTALLDTLTSLNLLDASAARWTEAHRAERGVSADTALLELDLIDEPGLLRGLEACFGTTAAQVADLSHVDPAVAAHLPLNVGQTFLMCPLRIVDDELVVFVERPLRPESLEGMGSLGFQIRQLLAPAHYLEVVRSQVYKLPLPPATEQLEARLRRRREAPTVSYVLDRVTQATTLSAAVAEVLDFSSRLLEFSGFLVAGEASLRLAAVRGGDKEAGTVLPLPEPNCTLAAAVRYGGYFVGPLVGSDADHAFYQSLDRELPRFALVAPIPVADGPTAVFYADNGPRGIATRWTAELMLLVSRLGQQIRKLRSAKRSRAAAADSSSPPPSPPPDEAGEPVEELAAKETDESAPKPRPRPRALVGASGQEAPPSDPPTPPPTLAAVEQVVLDRLRREASRAGVSLDVFVDDLLRLRDRHVQAAPPDANNVLLTEVKGLFEQLATAIPNQLAHGIETAFRDMGPRISSSAPATQPASAPEIDLSAPPPPEAQPPTAEPQLIQKVEPVKPESPEKRKVASYRSRRGKSKRMKL